MAKTDRTPRGEPMEVASFMAREDVVRSRAETDGIVDKARRQTDDLQTVTADLLRLIEEFKQ